MSERTQFWLGSVMLALAIGLLAGGVLFPRTTWGQDEPLTTPGGRYALLTGIAGSDASEQTIYLLDDVEDMLLTYEYDSRSHEIHQPPTLKACVNLRLYSAKVIEDRAKAKARRRPR